MSSNIIMDDDVIVTRPTDLFKTQDVAFVQPSQIIPEPESVSMFSGLSVMKYVLIILVLAFLGLNIFTTLGDVTDSTNKILAPFLSMLGYGVGETVKQTAQVASSGTKFAADAATSTVDNTVAIMEQSIETNNSKFNRIDNNDKNISSAINKKIYPLPEPDDSTSTTQRNQKNKSGYCYIGEDRGFRSCIKVGEGDKCMSGDIFPSEDICLNPTLRE